MGSVIAMAAENPFAHLQLYQLFVPHKFDHHIMIRRSCSKTIDISEKQARHAVKRKLARLPVVVSGLLIHLTAPLLAMT